MCTGNSRHHSEMASRLARTASHVLDERVCQVCYSTTDDNLLPVGNWMHHAFIAIWPLRQRHLIPSAMSFSIDHCTCCYNVSLACYRTPRCILLLLFCLVLRKVLSIKKNSEMFNNLHLVLIPLLSSFSSSSDTQANMLRSVDRLLSWLVAAV